MEVRVCTCKHHTESFGTPAVVRKEKGKEKPGIALSLAQFVTDTCSLYYGVCGLG